MPVPTIPGIPPETWEQILQVLSQLNTSVVELEEQGITTFEQLKQWLATQGYELVEISEVVGYTVCKTTAVDPTTSNAVANRVATDIATTGGAGTAVAQFTTGGNRTLGLVAKAVAVGACLSLLISTIGAGLVTDEVKEDLITSADPYTIDGENVPVLIDKNGKTHFNEEMVEAIRAKAIKLGIFNTGGQSVNIRPEGMTLPSWYTFPIDVYSDTIYTIKKPNQNYGSAYQVTGDAKVQGFVSTGNGSTGDIVLIVASPTPNTVVGKSAAYPVLPLSNNTLPASYTYNGKTVYWDSTSLQYRVSDGTPTSEGGDYKNFGQNTIFNDQNAWMEKTAWMMVYGSEGGTAVEGITPSQDLISAGVADTTKPLTEVIPKLAEGKMSIASPTKNDLTHKSNWYPVSINSEDVFTDGATEEETSTATDGNVKEDLQPAILDAINELIKQLNPDGTPDIPVSDSGDTPPAEPPLISGSANGLWSIYNPTLQQVQAFGAYLWSESILDQITRMFNSPIDAVIGFHMIYCTPIKGPAKNIKCGYLDTGVSSITVANQYVTIDCGTIEVPEYYRTALDYVATKLALYLPFIGIVPLSTAVCMGATLQVIYRIDVLTGTCLAQVKVIKENSDAVMYAFEGNCSVQIPLTATTYTGIASALINTVSAGLSVFMGDYISAAGDAGSALSAGMTNLSGTKQSGQMGANAGALGIRIPYLIITHPVSYDALQYNTQYGYPLNQTISLGSVTGYTRVKDIHLAGIPCTDDELEMIERLLKDGVIIN